MGRIAAMIIGLLLLARIAGTFHSSPVVRPGRVISVAPYPSGRATESGGQSAPGGWGGGGELILDRDGSGQFHVTASINGTSLPFLVDTGADTVALTIDAARAAGLNIDPSGFRPVAEGAGGAVAGQMVMIDRLEVGGHQLTNVRAMVLDGLGTNLLGQNVLKEMGGVELHGDRMVLK